VVARVLDACVQGEADFGQSAAWAALDPGLAARLLDAACSLPGVTPPCPLGLPEAFVGLGPNRVQPIVTHAAMGELFAQSPALTAYGLLWRDAIRTAHLAELIAQKAQFGNCSEAYLAGLLCNIGQFLMLKKFTSDYAAMLASGASRAALLLLERSQFETTHVEMGERMARRWNAASFLADAIRYQHYSLQSVAGAHPLVTICNLAVRLSGNSSELSDKKFLHGMKLFALSSDELGWMVRDAEATSEQAARELGLSDHGSTSALDKPVTDLFRPMRDLLLINGRSHSGSMDDSPLVRLAMQLRVAFGFSAPIFFLSDATRAVLHGHALPGQNPLINQLTISLVEDHGLCARSFIRLSLAHTWENLQRHGKTVLDEQVSRLAGHDGILCIPLLDRDKNGLGIAAVGIHESDRPLVTRESGTLLAMASQAGEDLASEWTRADQAPLAPVPAPVAPVNGASDRWYRYLVENSPDIVYTLDQNGRFQYLSNRIESLLGYHHHDLVGKDYHIIVHEDDRDRARFAFNERRIGPRATTGVELRLLRAATLPDSDLATPYITVELNSRGIYADAPEGSKGGFTGSYGVARDITERKKAEEVIRHQAYHDALTGLPNRALFADRLNVAVALAKRNRQNLAVMFLDLDRFKMVNDKLGHHVGDQMLQSVARRLANCLRRGDTLARFGGDEFILLLPQISDRDAASDTARKILSVLAYPFVIDGEEHHFGASIGIALFPEDSDNVDELIKCADSAMYKVKQDGRNNFGFHADGRIGRAQ
jgi:diguanylate cyclase (GGDEF)-like protein